MEEWLAVSSSQVAADKPRPLLQNSLIGSRSERLTSSDTSCMRRRTPKIRLRIKMTFAFLSIHIRFESRFRQFPQVSDFVEILGNGKLGKFSILGNNFCIRHGHYDTDELEQNQLFQSKLDIQGDLSSNENIPPLLPNPFFKIN